MLRISWQTLRARRATLAGAFVAIALRDVVVDARLRLRVGQTVRLVIPGGDGAFRVTGVADGRANRDRGQAAVFFADRTAAALSGTPGHVNAVGIVASPGTSSDALRTPAGGHGPRRRRARQGSWRRRRRR
jgi:hypothetical protein